MRRTDSRAVLTKTLTMTTPFSPPLYMQRYQFVIDYVQTYRPRKVNECQTWILKLICDGLWRIVWASLLIVVFFTCSYLDFISSFVTPSAGHRFRMRWMSLTEKTEVSSQRYTVTSGSWYQQCRPPEKNVSKFGNLPSNYPFLCIIRWH